MLRVSVWKIKNNRKKKKDEEDEEGERYINWSEMDAISLDDCELDPTIKKWEALPGLKIDEEK